MRLALDPTGLRLRPPGLVIHSPPMTWLSDPTAWIGLGTLVVLEIVLGIDNLIFNARDRDDVSRGNRISC